MKSDTKKKWEWIDNFNTVRRLLTKLCRNMLLHVHSYRKDGGLICKHRNNSHVPLPLN